MRTFKKVRGAPVFCRKKDRLLGYIADLTFRGDESRITGYWIHHHKWWSRKCLLPLSSLCSRTNKGFYAAGPMTLLSQELYGNRCFHGKNRLHGRSVKTDQGETVGIVEDVYFIPDSGKIIGYELTEGLLEDMVRGIYRKKTDGFMDFSTEQSIIISASTGSGFNEMPEL